MSMAGNEVWGASHGCLRIIGRPWSPDSDVTEEVPAHALSLFIGAAPQTDWLPEKLRSPAGWFETSLPGVYAAGDIRSGSIKGVAASAGEGAMVAQLVRRSLSGVPGSPVRQLERVLA